MEIFLDHASTTPLSDSMKQYLISVLDDYGNPSSIHSASEKPRQIIANARRSAAEFINVAPEDIYFTSGGSACNTLAIRGYYCKNDCTVFHSPIAHKSILKCAESCRRSQPLKVNKEGMIDLRNLEMRLEACSRQPFVIIDHANSEIGTIQNISELIETVHLHNGIIYLDCTGSIPQLPLDMKSADADMIGFSAHKLGGLKGCGVLYKKKTIALAPLIYGSQEQGYIGGTENVLGIASLGKAVEKYDYASISPAARDYVHAYIVNNITDSYLVGAETTSGNRLPLNLYMCFQGVEGESLMFLLDRNGIRVSTGSACNSQNVSASAALSAIGMANEDMHSCIRLSFSGQETGEELDYVCQQIKQCVESLRRLHAQEI